jgi:uracil-DNA glycosylase
MAKSKSRLARAENLDGLVQRIRACTLCQGHIPAPNPVLRVASSARVLIIGQAPGAKVHASGIPWDDASGRRLREWLGVSSAEFYDLTRIAIMPMGFCYPGKGKSGDLPPRPECAPHWHAAVTALLPNIRCTLLIGQYAQRHYLPDAGGTLTERVRAWQRHAPSRFVLPHPSPRNQLWLRRNPWFEQSVIPALQATVRALLDAADENE